LADHREANLRTFDKNPLEPSAINAERANFAHRDQRRHARCSQVTTIV
jgi:hypothetical protein